MTDSTWQDIDFNKMVASWLESTQNFWRLDDDATASDGAGDGSADGRGKSEEEQSPHHGNRTWERAMENYTAYLKLLSVPENQEQLGSSITYLTDAMTRNATDTLESITEFQTQLLTSFAAVGEHARATSWEDIDHETFRGLRQLYRSEFQKYLHIPKLGLPREHQERLSNLVDRTTLFNSYLAELLHLFSKPFDKTNREMQDIIGRMLKKGECECLEDPKRAYKVWIKTLEGNFMELLKSGEYTEVLNKTMLSLADCRAVRREVMAAVFKELQIPTNREMDEVYRDLYQMKKQIRILSKKVESLQDELAQTDTALSIE